jgi:5-methylcytosine-specific restriction endonuclease McrA
MHEAQWAAQQQREATEWRRFYEEYLKTPAWHARRNRVLLRAGHRCEGCGQQPATQVHHLTYRRLGHEMLFDLVAICRDCHHTIHPHAPDA